MTAAGDAPPPALPPPEQRFSDGVVRLPIDFNSWSLISRAFKNCCWSADNLRVFAPERETKTMMRSHVNVSPSLEGRGIDQMTFDAFTTAIKNAHADAAPYFSMMCAVMSMFTIVLIPFSCGYLCCCMGNAQRAHDELLQRLESVAKEFDSSWKARYGVRVRLEHDVKYHRPFIPAEDALVGFSSLPIRSSAWSGSVFVFTPE